MLLGALAGFATAFKTGNLLLALLMAMGVGPSSPDPRLPLCDDAGQPGRQRAGHHDVRSGLANFLGQRLGPASNRYNLTGMNLSSKFSNIAIPYLSDIPIIGALFDVSILTYCLYFLVPFAWFFLYKTRHGMVIRAVGENPRTAAAMGISVSRVRYLYTLIGGMLAGLGGACLSLSFIPSWNEGMTGGKGWIVIALVIFSAWNPARWSSGPWSSVVSPACSSPSRRQGSS